MLSLSNVRTDPPAEAAPPRPAPARAAPVRGPIRLAARRRVLVQSVAAVVWASGAAWLVFHYFVRTRGEFGPEPSPVEPWWLKLHGAAAFGALWAFGLLWGVHVVNGWGARRRRWSGGVMVALALVLIGSGYLLYYAGDDEARAVVSLTHWLIGLAAPLAFLWHRWLARDRR
jgi:hypothetical protein